jgi:hypothetical protein
MWKRRGNFGPISAPRETRTIARNRLKPLRLPRPGAATGKVFAGTASLAFLHRPAHGEKAKIL